MKNKERKRNNKLIHIISVIFLIVSVIVLILLSFSVKYQDLKDTYTLAEETATFIETSCKKYDNYMLGNSAKSMQSLLDKAAVLQKFISDSQLHDDDFWFEYIRTEHLSGIIVLDSDLSPVSQIDMDNDEPFELWKNILNKQMIKDILEYPQKIYSDMATLNDIVYNYVVISNNENNGLILCYESTKKQRQIPMSCLLKVF